MKACPYCIDAETYAGDHTCEEHRNKGVRIYKEITAESVIMAKCAEDKFFARQYIEILETPGPVGSVFFALVKAFDTADFSRFSDPHSTSSDPVGSNGFSLAIASHPKAPAKLAKATFRTRSDGLSFSRSESSALAVKLVRPLEDARRRAGKVRGEGRADPLHVLFQIYVSFCSARDEQAQLKLDRWNTRQAQIYAEEMGLS